VIVDQCLNVSLQELSRDTHPNPPERDARCRERLTTAFTCRPGQVQRQTV
jgi:hypothetical protein